MVGLVYYACEPLSLGTISAGATRNKHKQSNTLSVPQAGKDSRDLFIEPSFDKDTYHQRVVCPNNGQSKALISILRNPREETGPEPLNLYLLPLSSSSSPSSSSPAVSPEEETFQVLVVPTTLAAPISTGWWYIELGDIHSSRLSPTTTRLGLAISFVSFPRDFNLPGHCPDSVGIKQRTQSGPD